MLYSMTGFGRAVCSEEGVVVSAEAKSLNSRFLEIRLQLPALLSEFEPKFLELVRQYTSRGKVFLALRVVATGGLRLWDISLDDALLDAYADILQQLDARLLPERTTVNLDRLLCFDELFVRTPNVLAQRKLFRVSLCAAKSALQKLKKSRRQEGKALQEDIRKRLYAVRAFVRRIKRLQDVGAQRRYRRFRERVLQLLGDVELDESSLAQEVAHLAARADCTEEITRLETHIQRFLEALKSRKPVGSMLNFIVQECHREITTVGAKTDDVEIASIVIDVKEQLERIREQVQNIE